MQLPVSISKLIGSPTPIKVMLFLKSIKASRVCLLSSIFDATQAFPSIYILVDETGTDLSLMSYQVLAEQWRSGVFLYINISLLQKVQIILIFFFFLQRY